MAIDTCRHGTTKDETDFPLTGDGLADLDMPSEPASTTQRPIRNVRRDRRADG